MKGSELNSSSQVTLKDGDKFLQVTVNGMKRVLMRSSRCGSVVDLETTERAGAGA